MIQNWSLDADGPPRGLALPAGRRVVEHVAGVAAAEELAPHAKDLLEHRVDPPVAEGGEAGRRAHGPVEDRAEWQDHHRVVAVLRGRRQHFIDQLQQLLHAFQVPRAVLPAPRHLGDHLAEVHAHHRVAVDQLLELGEHRVHGGLPALGRYALPVTGQPCLKPILVTWQPATLMPHVPSRGVNSRRSSRRGIRHGRNLTSAGDI
ncbi:MAG TPA: hypothetical protein VHZ03_18140 [Trebonia sp.]|nr:hypothetical protein [Trebonia sp.]